MQTALWRITTLIFIFTGGLKAIEREPYCPKYIESCPRTCWSLAAEGDYWIVFRKTMEPHGFLYATGEEGGDTTYAVENMSRMDFRFKSGVMAGIAFSPTAEHTVELSYKGLIEWEQIRKANSPTNQLVVPTFPLTTHDWVDTTFVQIDYHAKFNTVELLYWNHVTPRYVDYFAFAWIIGVPGIKLTDRMVYNTTKEYPSNIGTFTDQYKISISNEMIGAEIGLDFEHNPMCYFTWGLQGKFGLMANMIEKTVFLNDQNSTEILVDRQMNTIRPSYLIDFNTYFTYHMKYAHIRIGYNYFNLYEAALSPNQIRRSKSLYQIHLSGQRICFNSFYAGLGFNW